MNPYPLLVPALLAIFPAATPAPGAESPCFQRTRVIGYSQVGQPRGGWFVTDGVFESLVGNDRWELLWSGGAGVDKWRDPGYAGWSQPLVSSCAGDAPPDRVLLSVSGPYGTDERAWVEAIEATLGNIRNKIPSARQIVLQAVVGGPGGKPCPIPAGDSNQTAWGGRVRASWQHQHIANAIEAVVEKRAADRVRVLAGFAPQVRTCDDYADALGHLTHAGAAAAARAIGEFYARQDDECRRAGHVRCGKGSAPTGTDSTAASSVVRDFQLNGERWGCVADGQPLAGILLKPQGNGPFPAILISHGMGSSAAQFGLLKAREFVKWGLVCIATDYTHARPGPDRAQLGASAENLRRARACLAILRALPYVDGKRICAYGNSMGAFLTIGLAVEVPEQLAAAAITAGGVVPIEGQAAPSAARAAKARVPMLILHGSADSTVPPQRSETLKQILDKSGVPSARHLFDGIGHNLHTEKAAEVYELMRAWFQKHGVLR